MDDKQTLLPSIPAGSKPAKSKRRGKFRWTALALCLFSLSLGFANDLKNIYHAFHTVAEPSNTCPQPSPLRPSDEDFLGLIYTDFHDAEFKNKSAHLLGAAVRIETESYDDLGDVGKDDRWDKFGNFHKWLESAFPNVHAKFTRETVNSWGLVYTWTGLDTSLKPLMFAAHQDVVPVSLNTVDQWIQPPYSGYFDGKWIWGRGSCDDKAGLVGTMIAMETLVRHDFSPTRTIVLAFGFDEEISGYQGAGYIGPFLLERYGKGGIAMILDEGSGYSDLMGQLFAVPAVGEKGYLDAKITVNTKGGHSSVPPPHTGIGILSALVTTIEEHPIPPKLTRLNPFYATLQCIAAYSTALPKSVRADILKSQTSDKALKKVQKWATGLTMGAELPIGWSMLATTQAATIISGGVKTNALPEQAYSVINNRIVVDSSTAFVRDHFTKLLAPVVDKYNLSLVAFGEAVTPSEGKAGSVVLTDAFGDALEPAPVSPVEGTAWDLLGGTIKAAVADGATGLETSTEEIMIAPGVMSGNTDTQHYWNLSPNIFRYAHGRPEGLFNGFHTVNEAMSIDNFMGHVQFVALLALNADESDL